MTSGLLPSSIADSRLQALAGLLDRPLPLAVLDLLYDPALCHPAALQALGDLLGVRDPAWHLLTTDTQRRALVAQAIDLQKKRGTPEGLKAALAAAGMPGVRIIERTKTWAHFKVERPAGSAPLTPQEAALYLPIVEAWKPARCVMEGWEVPLKFIVHAPLAFPVLYEGRIRYDGTRIHEGDPLDGAYALLGEGTPTLRVPTTSPQHPNDYTRVVTCTLAEDQANGRRFDCAALYGSRGQVLASITFPPTDKTPALTLQVQWWLTRD